MECLKLNHLLQPDAEDFFIEDLLNFPNDDGFLEEIDNSQLAKHTSPVTLLNDVKTTLPETELCLPENDDSDLEWVSQFVDDSFSGNYSSITCPAQKFPVTDTATLVTVNPSFQNFVHKKARSKRCRTGGRVWSLRSPSPLPEYSTSCSSSSSSYTSNPLIAVVESLGKPPVQKQFKKKPAAAGRRCNHCFVQKTPQWRTGPLGAKTLCNACGVRFKSGRLLPEYRPACSPTFSGEVHSNNHRKVLEMRRKKEEAP